MANWKEYTTKTTPEDADEIVIADTKANANKRTPFSGLWNWIANKLATAVISQLETQNKSIIPALNELNSKRSFIRIETGESRNTIVITPKNKNEAYHFSAFCFGDANGVYCTATISSIKQESTACSVSKIDDSYEIVIGRWGLLNVVSAQAFSYSIK